MAERGARYAAKLAGEYTYTSNGPCKWGHWSERLTHNGQCLECKREQEVERYHARPEAWRAKAKRYQVKYPGLIAEKARLARDAMPDERRVEVLQDAKIRSREWRKQKPWHRNALKRKYIADKGQRTPAWADLDAIVEFYKACPPGYHVDHIIPLRAKTVSGLHVLNNLQYLPAVENMRKNNRLVPEPLSA